MTLDERRAVPLEERQKRYDEIKALRDSGTSLAEIGRTYGVTRERVRRILDAGSPRPSGWPVEKQVENQRRRLLARREKWAARTSEAAVKNVAEIDRMLAELEKAS